MRIAFFTETFLPKVDGIVNTLCYLLKHLDERGHESILFAPKGAPDYYANTAITGLWAMPFPPYPELKLVPPFVDVSQQLKAFNPDLIHIVNPVCLGLVGLRQARKLGRPLVASYHTDIPGFAIRWGLNFLVQPFWYYLRWIHNQADLNLCPSKATQDELDAQRFLHTKVWTRGVDTQLFNPHHRTAAWRERLSAGQPEAPLLLYVGRTSPEKRVDWIRPVLDEFPQVNLAIVGDGPARVELEERFAGTSTVFTGFLKGQALANAYAAADIFVFPAANETLGNVVLEAMASGLPVIAPNSGGVLENVIDGENGLLFAPESQSCLIKAVDKLISHPELAIELGNNGRSYAENKSWGIILDKLLLDYMALIEMHQATDNRLPKLT